MKKVRFDTGNGTSSGENLENSEKNSPNESCGEQIDPFSINDSSNEAVAIDCDSASNSNSQGNKRIGMKFLFVKMLTHFFNSTVLFSLDDLGSHRRRPRGAKRGRPRGSRSRGGGNGSLGRTETSIASTSFDNLETSCESSPTVNVSTIRRGPGRPRLKPNGPANQGYRPVQKYQRRPIGPLVVPLGSSPAATPTIRSPAMSPVPSPSPSLHERGLGFYPPSTSDESIKKEKEDV